MSKSNKSTAKLRCVCLRFVHKVSGEVNTYYMVGGKSYGFLGSVGLNYTTAQFLRFFGGTSKTMRDLRKRYGKGWHMHRSMYDQSLLNLPTY